jgi:HD superfamily phosphohydrolase
LPLLPPNRESLVGKLSEVPLAKHVLEDLATDLLPPCPRVLTGKEVNDPVWKIIHLTPLEVSLLDTPLMQRLRRVRQLGLAHLVYPGASNSRLEHSIGVMHAARRMFDVLSEAVGTALNEGERGRGRDIIGIAGLLHDCGHVVFSHVGETILGRIANCKTNRVAST